MSTAKWHEEPFGAFDTETTGTDPEQARIVTAAIVHRIPGERPKPLRWIIDPEVDIPTEASDVHGYTNARLEQEIGRPGWAVRILPTGARAVIPRDVALYEITTQIAALTAREQAVIVHNAPFDCTLLDQEATRNKVEPLTARPHGIRGVVDPMVIEKAFDPYRKSCYKKAPDGTPCDQENRVHVCGGCRGGKWDCSGSTGVGCGSTDRTLGSLCAHYGVVHAGAHDCADDAIATVRLLWKLLEAWPEMARWKLETLHQHQVGWRKDQQASLAKFFNKVGKDHDGCCGAWPVHTPECADAHRQVEGVAA